MGCPKHPSKAQEGASPHPNRLLPPKSPRACHAKKAVDEKTKEQRKVSRRRGMASTK